MKLALSFHSSRDQPLSDLVNGADACMFLTASTPIQLNVSIMTSRGLSFLDLVTLSSVPYKIPYEPPWGRDWSVLQLAAIKPRPADDSPYEVSLQIERSTPVLATQ
jgi:hypothetical protein